ncbi:hypothetical protein CEP52_001712 [Fusarium oligoseptatum]|uniref:Uncharacterized protein n=1 Tax=Fusarium oligoseptatum TaxID=2604345 RepID=A0A428UHH6_9HYPO|nr:hypothetical protein CEP52_001712 [Fusarium oligoseptatum]
MVRQEGGDQFVRQNSSFIPSPSSTDLSLREMPTLLDDLESKPLDDLGPTSPDDREPGDPAALQVEMGHNIYYIKHDHARDAVQTIRPKYNLNDGEACQDLSPPALEKHNNFWRLGKFPRKLVGGALVSFGLIPAVHSAWTLSRGFRVASGMTSTITAMTVVPLRTASHIPQAAWIATYVAWALCFFVYVWLQLINIPHRPRDKRTIYIFTVAMASLHFTIGLSQGAESIMEGAALFALIVSTASAYLMSLLITINWREAGFVVYELA